MAESLRVIINAQLLPGGIAGGIEQFLVGLVHSLAQLEDGPEQYIIIGHWQAPDWLRPYLGTNQKIVRGLQPQQPPLGAYEWAKRMLGPLRGPAGRLYRGALLRFLGPTSPDVPVVPISDGFYEALGGNLIHFPFQDFVRCKLPTVYNPHDLQHRHYSEFFTREETALRETLLKAGCQHAEAVGAESRWAKEDISRQFDIDPERIHVIRRGAPTELYRPVGLEHLQAAQEKFRLPETFALYPAQTWAHKNHVRLLEAVNLLRHSHAVCLNLICTGRLNGFWPKIANRLRDLRLENHVRFLGFVHPMELRALYHLAQFVVLPSLFEGGGFPVVESFCEAVSVACSDATSLPEYAGNAALFFDPNSVPSIAGAMLRMTKDSALRATLVQRGTERIRQFTWEQMAKSYRALYRKLTGRLLCEEDSYLLENQAGTVNASRR